MFCFSPGADCFSCRTSVYFLQSNSGRTFSAREPLKYGRSSGKNVMSSCWSYINPENMVWHFNCLVLIGDEIRRGVHQSRSPVVYRYTSDLFRLFSLSMSFALSLFSGYSRLLHHRQPHLKTWWEYSTLTVYITKYPTIAIHRCYLIDIVMEGVHSKIAVKWTRTAHNEPYLSCLGASL